MAVTAKVISGSLPSAAGDTEFTSSGFGTPDAALVFVTKAHASANPNPDIELSIGLWDGTTQMCRAMFSDSAQTATRAARYRSESHIALCASYDGSTHTYLAKYTISTSGVTDGVKITLASGDDNTTAARYATVVLLKGLTNKKAYYYDNDGAGGAIDVTAPGFTPDLVFFVSNAQSSTVTEATHGYLSFGVAAYDGTTITQHSIALAVAHADTTTVVNSSVNDNCALRFYLDDGGIVDGTRLVSAFDANGFTATPNTGSTTAARDIYLALELPDPDDAYVAIVDSRTSTGTGSPYTGTGFTPILLGLFGNTDTATNSTSASPTGAMSFGWADATAEQSLIVRDEDAVASSSGHAASRADLSNVLNLRFDDDSVDAVAALDSFDSDGWTLNYSDASASARKMLAIAIGASTSGTTVNETAGFSINTGYTQSNTGSFSESTSFGVTSNFTQSNVSTLLESLTYGLTSGFSQSNVGTFGVANTFAINYTFDEDNSVGTPAIETAGGIGATAFGASPVASLQAKETTSWTFNVSADFNFTQGVTSSNTATLVQSATFGINNNYTASSTGTFGVTTTYSITLGETSSELISKDEAISLGIIGTISQTNTAVLNESINYAISSSNAVSTGEENVDIGDTLNMSMSVGTDVTYLWTVVTKSSSIWTDVTEPTAVWTDL